MHKDHTAFHASDATNASEPHFSRRAELGGVAAGIAAPAVALGAEAQSSPLRALFHEWQAAEIACNTCDPHQADMIDAFIDRTTELKRRAAAFVPRTFEDLAFKIIFADDGGDMSMNRHQEELVREVYRLMGVAALGGEDDGPRRAGTYLQPVGQVNFPDWVTSESRAV